MLNEAETSPQIVPSRSTTTAWEVVCPDGGVRHFPYADKNDAEYDATLCAEEGCQIFPESQWLEPRRPPCSGGRHRIVRARNSHKEANVGSDLGTPASP